MPKDIKPAYDYDQQLANLRERGLLIPDADYAKQILQEISYYRLINAYRLSLYTKDAEQGNHFNEGTTFETVVALYRFDEALRHILSELIERFEILFRTRLGHYIAINYGPLGYMDEQNFEDKNYFRDFIDTFEREKRTQSKSVIVKHHDRYYGGYLPIWAAMEILSFGTTSKLYANLNNSDQNNIASDLGTSAVYLKSWLRSFVEVRNLCAHYGRLYNRNLLSPPRLYSDIKQLQLNEKRIFAVLCILKRFFKTQDLFWTEKIDKLDYLFIKYPAARLDRIGFPDNWQKLLEE